MDRKIMPNCDRFCACHICNIAHGECHFVHNRLGRKKLYGFVEFSVVVVNLLCQNDLRLINLAAAVTSAALGRPHRHAICL
jgi:hypothetical protein